MGLVINIPTWLVREHRLAQFQINQPTGLLYFWQHCSTCGCTLQRHLCTSCMCNNKAACNAGIDVTAAKQLPSSTTMPDQKHPHSVSVSAQQPGSSSTARTQALQPPSLLDSRPEGVAAAGQSAKKSSSAGLQTHASIDLTAESDEDAS